MGKFKKYHIILGISSIIVLSTLVYSYNSSSKHNKRVEEIKKSIQTLDNENRNSNKVIEENNVKIKGIEEAITEANAKLDSYLLTSKVEELSEDEMIKEQRKLLIEARDTILNNGEYLGIQAYYDKKMSEEEVSLLEKQITGKIKSALIKELGLGKLFKVIGIIEDIRQLKSIGTTDYAPETLVTNIANVIKEHGNVLNNYVTLDDAKLTSEGLVECLASIEEIGNSYDKLREMTNGEINEFSEWKEVHNSVKSKLDKLLEIELKLNGGKE